MNKRSCLLVVCIAVVSYSLVSAESNKISVPQINEERYTTEKFGICTFAKGKDRSRYVQPYLKCISGIESFSIVPQEDKKWAILVSVQDEPIDTDEEERPVMLDVTMKVDDNDPHELSMLWPRNWDAALRSYELPELVRLLDELRKGESVTISRNGQDVEFDLYRANEAIPELVFEQLFALSKINEVKTQQ